MVLRNVLICRRVSDRLQGSLNHETNSQEPTTSAKMMQHQRGQKKTVNCSAEAESREAKEKELGESSTAIIPHLQIIGVTIYC